MFGNRKYFAVIGKAPVAWWVLVPLSISLTRCLSVMLVGQRLTGVCHSFAERGL